MDQDQYVIITTTSPTRTLRSLIRHLISPKPVDYIFLYFDSILTVEPNSALGYQLLKYTYRKMELGKHELFLSKALKQKIQKPTIKKHYCFFCKRKLGHKNKSSIDHFIPRFHSDNPESLNNYNFSCYKCNYIKGSIHPVIQEKLFSSFKKYVKKGQHQSRTKFWLWYFKKKLDSKEVHQIIQYNRTDLPASILVKLSNNSEYKFLIQENIDNRFGNIEGKMTNYIKNNS